MAEYIEREAALAVLCEYCDGTCKEIGVDACVEYSNIMSIPTADVVEVRHGVWEYHECVSTYDGAQSGYSCSECSAFVYEETFDSDEFYKDFCGNCGAKMDGGDVDG